MSTFTRLRASVRLTRSLPVTLPHRAFSAKYKSEALDDTHSTVSKQYEQACERSARFEQQWIQNRQKVQEATGNSPITFPSYARDLEEYSGPFEMDIRKEAQRAVDRHSKYAWVPCNYGAKFVLQGQSHYFSLDEINAYSGVYLVSVATKKPSNKVKKGKKGISVAQKGESRLQEAPDVGKAPQDMKESGFTFGYYDRKVLLRADTFQEAILHADALVEKMITSKTQLATMERYAAWRNEPSTARQINFLLRLGANSRETNAMKVALMMNKGQVSSLITDAVMKFEKSPQPEMHEDEGDSQPVEEVPSATDLHSNFMLSDGLWDLES